MGLRHLYCGGLLVLTAMACLLGCNLSDSADTSPATGVVEGIVWTDSDQPAVGAQVLFSGESLLTDNRGRFRIDHAPAGSAELEVSLQWYETARQEITVTGGASTSLEVVLVALALTAPQITGISPEETLVPRNAQLDVAVQLTDEADYFSYQWSVDGDGWSLQGDGPQVTLLASSQPLVQAELTVTVANPHGESDSASFLLSTDENVPPQLSTGDWDGSGPSLARGAEGWTLQLFVDDPDDDAHSFELRDADHLGLSLDENGLLSWEPRLGEVGAHAVRVAVDDGYDETELPLHLEVTPFAMRSLHFDLPADTREFAFVDLNDDGRDDLIAVSEGAIYFGLARDDYAVTEQIMLPSGFSFDNHVFLTGSLRSPGSRDLLLLGYQSSSYRMVLIDLDSDLSHTLSSVVFGDPQNAASNILQLGPVLPAGSYTGQNVDTLFGLRVGSGSGWFPPARLSVVTFDGVLNQLQWGPFSEFPVFSSIHSALNHNSQSYLLSNAFGLFTTMRWDGGQWSTYAQWTDYDSEIYTWGAKMFVRNDALLALVLRDDDVVVLATVESTPQTLWSRPRNFSGNCEQLFRTLYRVSLQGDEQEQAAFLSNCTDHLYIVDISEHDELPAPLHAPLLLSFPIDFEEGNPFVRRLDFDGDGRDDFAFYDPATGAVAVLY